MTTTNQIAMLRKIIETSDFVDDNGNYASAFIASESDKGTLGSLAAAGLVTVTERRINKSNDSWVELNQSALDLINDEPAINWEPLTAVEQQQIADREIAIIGSGLSLKNKRELFASI